MGPEPFPLPRRILLGILPAGLLGVLAAGTSSPCRHPPRGESRKISLPEVRRAQEDLKRRLSWAMEEISRLSPDSPFDAGLPACAVPSRRRAALEMPRELVGRTIVFAPEGRGPEGDIRVATSVRRLGEVRAEALADPALLRRFGIRCAPTVVVVRSTEEVELVERP